MHMQPLGSQVAPKSAGVERDGTNTEAQTQGEAGAAGRTKHKDDARAPRGGGGGKVRAVVCAAVQGGGRWPTGGGCGVGPDGRTSSEGAVGAFVSVSASASMSVQPGERNRAELH